MFLFASNRTIMHMKAMPPKNIVGKFMVLHLVIHWITMEITNRPQKTTIIMLQSLLFFLNFLNYPYNKVYIMFLYLEYIYSLKSQYGLFSSLWKN